jgi:secreted PhoX family phosphatase
VLATGDSGATRLNRLCSADLAPISAFYNPASGKGYNGRIYLNGEEGGTQGRPFGHVVATGQSYELTPWLGNMSYENSVAHPDTGSDTTVVVNTDDGDAAVDQQVYVYRGTKQNTGNAVEKAGLRGGQLFGIKVLGVPQYEYQKTNWQVGDEFDFSVVNVSANAGNAALLDADSHAGGVTSFQRPEDGAWDPQKPSDFYFVTTSSFGPAPGENRTGQTRLWRLRFDDPTNPSLGGTIELLVSGPVGTSGDPNSPGPQMFDNITVNDRGQVLLQEDVGNQPYLGGVWIYDISSGELTEIAEHDPNRFVPGAPGFLTQDEEASGIIPAPFLGEGKYLIDTQAHYNITGELVQGGQLMELHVPPGKFN